MRKQFLITFLMILFLAAGCSQKTVITAAPTTNATPGNQSVSQPAEGVFKSNVTVDPNKTPVIISQVVHENGLETIYVTNVSDKKQDISGFTLLIQETSEHQNIINTSLEAGASLKVFNGPEAKNQKDGLVWLDHPILVNRGDQVILLKASRVIWTFTYYP